MAKARAAKVAKPGDGYDTVVRGGRVIDPANGIDAVCDIAIRKGRIAAVGPARAIGLGMDVASEASVRTAFEEAVLAYGGLDIVVSNAGIAHSSPVDQMTLAEQSVLAAKGVTGVRLSCQMLCDHDMTVRAISRLAGSGRLDAGHRPADEIQPQPVTWVSKS